MEVERLLSSSLANWQDFQTGDFSVFSRRFKVYEKECWVICDALY